MATISELLTKMVEMKNQLVANLVSMGVEADESEKLNTLVPKILNVETGVDTTDATATAEDIFYGKTAYVNDIKIVGKSGPLKGHFDLYKHARCLFRNDRETYLYVMDFDNYIMYNDTKNVTDMEQMFYSHSYVVYVPSMNTSKVTNMTAMFSGCKNLYRVGALDTRKVTNMDMMFYNCCNKLREPPELDMISVTSADSMFFNCQVLEKCWLKNIKISIQVGSGSSYGHLLTEESLLFMIKELINTGSLKTFTIGTANLEKLASIYVKKITITDEMRAEDENIDLKLPFEVCTSTTSGAQLITSYVTSKNWTLK